MNFYGIIIVVCFKKFLYIPIYNAYFSPTFNVKETETKECSD